MEFVANISTMFRDVPMRRRFNKASAKGFKACEAQFLYDVDEFDKIVEGKYNAKDVKLVMMNSPCNPGPVLPQGSATLGGVSGIALAYATGTKSAVNIVHRDPSEFREVHGGFFGMASVPGFQQEFYNSILEVRRICDILDCRKLHIIAGLAHEPEDHENYELTYVTNLTWAVEQLEEYNIVALIEPICRETKSNYFLDCFEKAIRCIEKVNSDNLKLLLDVYHLYKIEGHVDNLEKYLPYAGHIQISQSPGRTEPFAAGDIDYAKVLDTIKNNKYKGHVGLEYFPLDDANPNFEWLERYNAP